MNRPIVILGDILLDVDLTGEVDRVCPDAPALVVQNTRARPRPGGAGLAAMLAIQRFDVTLVTTLADDEPAAQIRTLLDERIRLIALAGRGSTPVKQRIRAGGQTLLRMDSGTGVKPDGLTDPAISALRNAAAILISDYGQGITREPEIRRLVEQLADRIPVVWDPHPRGAAPVPGCALVTPNETEAARAAEPLGIPVGGTEAVTVNRRAEALVHGWQVSAVSVTRGEHGAILSPGDGSAVAIPAPYSSSPVTDTCGAGDCFAATATGLLGTGALLSEAVCGAVESASAYVRGAGAARSSKRRSPATPAPVDDLIRRTRTEGAPVVATGGCFDLLHVGHIATLQAARELGGCLIVCLNSDDSVRRLKGPDRPVVPAADRARVLEALGCVDAVVIFDDTTPCAVLDQLRPDIWVKGADYAGLELAEDTILRRWGGRVILLPYLPGRSTTRLLASHSSHVEGTKV